MKLVGTFEYPEERRMAMQSVITDLKSDHPELLKDDAIVRELFEIAKREEMMGSIKAHFPQFRKSADPPQ